MQTKNMNLVQLIQDFTNDDECLQYLEELRWPDGVKCPRCSSDSISRITTRGQLDCNSCRYRFSVTSGTIFHDTHLPLSKWFLTVYMMIESKKGMSAKQIERSMGIGSYRTAWFLCHRIRGAMRDAYPFPLRGIVEVDETYVGGKTKGMGRGYRGNKTAVVGAVQRGGKIALQVIRGPDRETLHGFIHENVADDTEAIYTDDWPAYRGIEDADTRHETVNHSMKQWVHGKVHTNTVEGVWSLLKRSVIGTYHKLSMKHLNAYLDELEWRYNNRDNPFLFRDTLRQLLSSPNLQYRELVEGTKATG